MYKQRQNYLFNYFPVKGFMEKVRLNLYEHIIIGNRV